MAKRTDRRFALGLADDSRGTRLEDLSEGGMRILSDKVFQIDQIFPTKIRSHDGPISVKARIVRACLSRREEFKYEYGAQLTMATPEDEARMRAFVEDLSESSSELPEEPGEDDLRELQNRIASLQDSLEELQDRQTLALEQQKSHGGHLSSGSDVDDSSFSTSFTKERFTHLAGLGQPMIVTVPDPAAGLVGERYHLIADALTDPFDLDSLSKSLRGVVPKKVIPETLFDFYDRNRIDFA